MLYKGRQRRNRVTWNLNHQIRNTEAGIVFVERMPIIIVVLVIEDHSFFFFCFSETKNMENKKTTATTAISHDSPVNRQTPSSFQSVNLLPDVIEILKKNTIS